jgi:hypothetical protein
MARIVVAVPEAFALDHNGHQLSKLVVKRAKSQAEMQPQLKAFNDKWAPRTKPMSKREKVAVA